MNRNVLSGPAAASPLRRGPMMAGVKAAWLFSSVLLLFGLQSTVWAQSADGRGAVQEEAEVHHDTSPPLKDIPPSARETGQREHLIGPVPRPHEDPGAPTDAAQQANAALAAPATATPPFAGIGNGFTGPAGTFSVTSAPPDTNGSVGPNHYVQIVNTDFAVFNKSGVAIYGPVPINTLWSGFGGGCQTNNDGDPTVIYDKMADRWVITQFSVSTTPYLQCVAVSQTGDPTGAYYRYSFSYGSTDFPDYPKVSAWSDAYYQTFNIFANGTTFSGARVCAYDRTKMLAGAAATQQCFQLSNIYGGLLASDLDGVTPPPAGSPNYILALGAAANTLDFWKFHVDWTTPGNSTLTGPSVIPVPAFSSACAGGGTCIPQSGTTQQLDSLADRLMYRLAYRNFGDHEALVVNHSVTAGTSVGLRWYEIRSPATAPTLYQTGTYAPDASYRWLGSIAMDQAGNMALGYSRSSNSLHPAIYYTGRLATDALGTMSPEVSIIDGAGSQTAGLSRWGDYSAMAIDPSDDCTFWYTNEYIPANGSFNWATRIASFKFPGCGVASDFSITSVPASFTLVQGASASATISTTVTAGSAGPVALTVSGLPTGATATLSPATISAGTSSALTVNSGTATPGSYILTVTGIEGATVTHSTTVTVNITVPAPADFSIGLAPTSLSVAQNASASSTISTAVVAGTAGGTVALTVSGLPSGASAVLSSTTVAAGAGATLTVNAGTAVIGAYTVTVSGTEGSAVTHSATLNLNVTAPAGFTIGAAPATLNIQQGASASSTISTGVVGAAGSVSLTASVSPAGPTVSLSPASVAAGGSSALTISVGSTVAVGTYTVTVTGIEGTVTQLTVLTVNVAAAPTGIVNGGFEAGSLNSWSRTGTTGVTGTGAHSGSFAAMLGSAAPTNGDSSIAQTFVVPAGVATLSFWYKVTCPDTVTYDWARATLKDVTTGTTATILNRTCTNNGVWTKVSSSLSGKAGHRMTLTLISHDDNYAGDATFTLYDDVAIN